MSRRHLRLRPAGLGSILIVVLLVIFWLIVDARALALLIAALLFLVLVDAIRAFRAARIVGITLTPTEPPTALETTNWDLSLDGFRRPVAVTLAGRPHHAGWSVPSARPGAVELEPMHRGLLHFLVFDVTASGGLGLWRAYRRIRWRPERPIVVMPRPRPMAIRWPEPAASGFGFVARSVRGDDLFRGVRPYVRGDERRKVHWKATAHHGELMVREDDGTGEPSMQLVVDPGSDPATADDVTARAIWLIRSAWQRGWRIELVTLDLPAAAPRIERLGPPLRQPPYLLPPVTDGPRVRSRTVTRITEVDDQLATAVSGRVDTPAGHTVHGHLSPAGLRWR